MPLSRVTFCVSLIRGTTRGTHWPGVGQAQIDKEWHRRSTRIDHKPQPRRTQWRPVQAPCEGPSRHYSRPGQFLSLWLFLSSLHDSNRKLEHERKSAYAMQSMQLCCFYPIKEVFFYLCMDTHACVHACVNN